MSRALIVACLLMTAACTAEGPPSAPPAMSVIQTLGSQDTAGYERAFEVRELQFPDDHGSHPDFKNEWWYTTGNLETSTGKRFGFQFTLFRSALAPPPDAPVTGRTSAWATRQAFLAHAAVSDIDKGTFHHFERYSRGGDGACRCAGVSIPGMA